MANMGRCDKAIYADGEPIAVIANVSARVIEAVVQEASDRVGFKIDWHYIGGRANVLTLGDPATASAALREVLEGLPRVMWNCDGSANDPAHHGRASNGREHG